MIDTVNISLYTNEISERNINITNETINKQTGELGFYGFLGNLRVKKDGNNIFISNSLCKYYLGNSLNTLSRNEIEKAIEKLSDELEIPLRTLLDGNLTRIDIGENFIMKEPLQVYYNSFGAHQNSTLKKTIYNNNESLYYQNKSKSKCLALYDKINESKEKRVKIPDHLKNKNLLRIEYRLQKRIKNTLKVNPVFVKNLLEEKFYTKLIELWKTTYFQIERLQKYKMNSEENMEMNFKLIQDLSLINYINQMGGLEIASQQFQLPKQTKYRLRKKIKEIEQKPNLFIENDSLKELDEKVNWAAKYYR
ncbi:MAG: hypothetical protein K8F60_10600 [Melioribacteraceae bacterium]|nr:hypothetical protein [Melioribacteraceae bacterium]